jgi:hypothetical protein
MVNSKKINPRGIHREGGRVILAWHEREAGQDEAATPEDYNRAAWRQPVPAMAR